MNREEWVEGHLSAGHHPNPAPTQENPERWDCDCGNIWRILTPAQIERKFAHLNAAAADRQRRLRRVDRAKARPTGELLDHLEVLLANWEDGTELPYGALPTVARGFAAQLREAIQDQGSEGLT